jgi:3-phosphoshikimate 1-carboxyvinyltransferase
MLKGFGVDIKEVYLEKTGMHITLTPPQHLIYKNNDSKTLKIPSDFSSAAYFIVLALITGMDLTIHDISINPTRSALLNVFEAFGIPQRKVDDIRTVFQGITIRYVGETMGEPFGDIRINTLGLDLQNGTVSKDIIPLVIDEIPILSIYGLFASGELRVDHAAELRVKESDRIKTIVQMITALGGVINETDEGFQLRGNPEHVSPSLVRIDPHFDHRIAMSSIIASLATQTEIQVKDIDCINTSFPHFMEVVDGLIS